MVVFASLKTINWMMKLPRIKNTLSRISKSIQVLLLSVIDLWAWTERFCLIYEATDALEVLLAALGW